MTVPFDTTAADGAPALLSAVGDAFAGRRLGFGMRRAALAARFARHRGADEPQAVGCWLAGALAELGLVRVVLGPSATDRERRFALADAPLHGARLFGELGLPAQAADTVRWHREHDDGTGFPDGLRWDGIPADAAALGICHAFLEAVEDPAEPRPAAEALFAVAAESGRRFPVELVRRFRAFVAADLEGWDAAPELPVPALDGEAAIRALAGWVDARDDRTAGRSERLAGLAGPLAARLGLEAARAERLVRLYALGRATTGDAAEGFDPLSRFAREHRGAEARRAGEIVACAPRFAAEAPVLAGSAVWHEDAPGDRYAGIVALVVAVDALDPIEHARRVAAAAGTQFDPEIVRAYLVSLGAAR